MQLGFNGATTLKADLLTDIEVAGESGYDAVEIWAPKLVHWLMRGGTLPAIWEQMHSAGVRAHSINSIERINFCDERSWVGVQRLCHAFCAAAGFLEIPWVVVVPGPRPEGMDGDAIRQETVRSLRELSDLAGQYGDVGLAFEFLGFVNCSVNTLADAWAIVREVDRPNVGLVLDTFHFHAGGSRLKSIAEVDPAKLAIVHINDAENRPPAELSDAHRLLPGRGVIPLEEIMAAIVATGWDGVVSVELFRPEYWEWNAPRLAQEAKAAVERLLQLTTRETHAMRGKP